MAELILQQYINMNYNDINNDTTNNINIIMH